MPNRGPALTEEQRRLEAEANEEAWREAVREVFGKEGYARVSTAAANIRAVEHYRLTARFAREAEEAGDIERADRFLSMADDMWRTMSDEQRRRTTRMAG